MAEYTDSIREILQREQPNTDFTNIDNITTAAKTVLFPAGALDLIDQKHADLFAGGFALHYFMDEIGVPVFSLWQINLMEKIVNNHAYINQIYDHLDRQVLSQYHSRRRNTDASETETYTPDLTDTTTTTSTVSGTGTDTTTRDGTNTVKQTGTDTLNVSREVTDTSTNTTTGTESGTASTDETVNVEGSNTQTGSYTDSNSGNTVTNTFGEQANKSYDRFSNTPQNGLADVENGRYLTNARVVDGSVEAYTNTTENGESTITRTYNNHKDQQETNTITSSSTETAAEREATETGNSTSNTTGADTRTLDLTTAESRDLTDTTTREDSTEGSTSGTLKRTGTSTTGRDRDEEETEEEQTFDLSVLMKSDPLLSRVWRIFDDLFMMIY